MCGAIYSFIYSFILYYEMLGTVQGWVFPSKTCFSIPKWDKPVFPVQNWEKLSKTGINYAALYFRPEKVSKNVMYQIKI